jgi:hypothetical protein
MDDGRINTSSDHGDSYTCAEKEISVALLMFIVRLFCITSTHTEQP